MAIESPTATRVRTVLAEHLKRDVRTIHTHASLKNDLGLDSLGTLCAVVVIKVDVHVLGLLSQVVDHEDSAARRRDHGEHPAKNGGVVVTRLALHHVRRSCG